MSNKTLTSPHDFTRRKEIEWYATLRGIGFSDAIVELVNFALSEGAIRHAEMRQTSERRKK